MCTHCTVCVYLYVHTFFSSSPTGHFEINIHCVFPSKSFKLHHYIVKRMLNIIGFLMIFCLVGQTLSVCFSRLTLKTSPQLRETTRMREKKKKERIALKTNAKCEVCVNTSKQHQQHSCPPFLHNFFFLLNLESAVRALSLGYLMCGFFKGPVYTRFFCDLGYTAHTF